MKEIKFCENNFVHGSDDVIKRLENSCEGINIEVEPCLGYCGDCANGPYALVDDELVQADSDDELFDIIKNSIK